MGAQVHLGTGESAEVPRGRVCNRASCGKLLVDVTGRPVFNRHFCSDDCKKADVRERQRERRRRFAGKKCPYCGRKSPHDPGVSRHRLPSSTPESETGSTAQEAQLEPAERL